IRVCRTLREMAIPSVAIYSEADQDAPHVFAADEAYPAGPAPAAQSYLHAERILEAARRAGADAIHPGYGFLSESAAFAEEVERAGLVWIGPSPSAIKALGDKLSARAMALRAGVPVLPGTETPLSDEAELRKAADRIGFPVALKAAAGGGGKGLRRVNTSDELAQALRLTQGEARNAFGDDRIYLERWLERPRHIEVQLLGDAQGNVIALGERDCSIQRRHQKLVEETPSPALDETRRKEPWGFAVKVARAGGYTNAGTAEFLMDRSGKFYFLEVNARLQVEHPVTEMVLGLDLVREQIRLAQGEPLPWTQEAVRPRGASIGVRSGGQVPVHYDPLIGKIIVWGDTRDAALSRAARALGECVLSGIPNTLRFHRWLLEQEPFRSGGYDTSFVALEYKGQGPSDSAHEAEDAAILAALHLHSISRGPRFSESGDSARNGDAEQSRWRLAQPGLRAPWRPR
ncbi:MAG: ATP-grasp domain-containing protein, partial [Candidatus Eisenbacteria bacterium]